MPRSFIVVNVEFISEKMSCKPRSDIHLGEHQPSNKLVDPFFGEQPSCKHEAQNCPEPPQFNCSAELGVTRPLVCSDDMHGLEVVMKRIDGDVRVFDNPQEKKE